MAAACALAIISGKIILNFGFLKSLRTFQKPFFHERGRNGKRQLPRLLPAEAAARWERFLFDELPQSKPDGFASSLGEGASGAPTNFALEPETVPLCQGPHPRGGCRANARLGEFSHKHFFCTNCLHSVQITKKFQTFCQISHTYLRKFEQIAKNMCF